MYNLSANKFVPIIFNINRFVVLGAVPTRLAGEKCIKVTRHIETFIKSQNYTAIVSSQVKSITFT